MGYLMLLLLTLTACVGEELQKPLLGEGEGYLTLQVGAISAEVTSSTLTKATVPNAPTKDQLTITITNKSTKESQSFASISAVPNPMVLKAGVTYTVEASHGKNEALQDSPYFFGSQDVTIQANTNNPVTVTASLANAMIIPDISKLQDHYQDGWTLTAATTSNATMPLSFTDGKCTFYAKAGETVKLNFEGTNKAGEPADATWTSISNVEACKAYTVECNPNLAAFENIQVTATATHTKDSNGDLDGTDVVLNSNLNGANGDAIQTWNVEVKYNGTTIRSYSGSAPNNLKMTQTNGWPYIPQGSSLSASVTLKAGDKITVGSTFALQPSTFEVKVTGTTSYDLYLAEDISGANGMDAGTIKGIGAKAKIANALLSNSNYSHTFTLTYNNEEHSSETSTITVGDKTNQSWGNHPITATMVFDGQSIEAKKDCHITGLPYKPTNMIEADWEFASWNNKYKNSYIQLGGITGSGECSATSKMTFHIPKDLSIKIETNATVRDYQPVSRWYTTTFSLSVNGNTIISKKNSSSNSDGINYDLSGDASFQPNSYSLKLNSSYTLAGPWVKVYTLHILYK